MRSRWTARWAGALALGGACLAAAAAAAQGSPLPAASYQGQYVCAGQRTSVTLDASEDGTGVFRFATSAVGGAYRVRFDGLSDGRVVIRPLQWIERPPGFIMVPVVVQVAGERLAGRVQSAGCGAFEARAGASGAMASADRPAGGRAYASPDDARPGARRSGGVGGEARPGGARIGSIYGGRVGAAPTAMATGRVDGPAIVARARQTAAQQPDAGRCVAERAALLRRAKIPRTFDADEYIAARPQVYQAVAEGMACLARLANEARRGLESAIDRDPDAKDLKALREAAQSAYDAVNRNGDDIAEVGGHWNSVSTGARDIGEAAVAMRAVVDPALGERIRTSMGAMSYVGFDPDRKVERDFYARLVDRVAKASSDEVNAMATDLVPVFNAALFPSSVPPGSTVSGWQGAGRQDVARGADPVANARSDPSPGKLFWMVAALGDPVQRTALAARARPVVAGAPSAQDLASMFARSFLKAETARADPLSKTWFSSGTFGSYGAMVEWGMPNRIVTPRGNSMPLYAEEYRFMVNDLDAPDCQPVKGGAFRCRFQYAADTRYEGLPDELARGLGALLGVGESSDQRRRTFVDRLSKRNFDWQRAELVVSKSAAGWQSAEVDAQMTGLAAKVDQVRQARLRAMQAAADGMAQARQSNGVCDAFAAGAMAVGRMSEYFYYKYAC